MRDFLLGLVFMVGGGVVYIVAQQYPTMASLQYGPSLFPSLIGGGCILGGLVLAITHVRALKGALQGTRSGLAAVDYRGLIVSVIPCALIVFYILFSDTLGATVCMGLIMLTLMLMRRTPLLMSLAVSVIASLVIYLLFSRYLLIPLPEGMLATLG